MNKYKNAIVAMVLVLLGLSIGSTPLVVEGVAALSQHVNEGE